MKDKQSENACRLCGSQDFSLAIPMPETPIGDNFSLNQKQSEAEEKRHPLDIYLCNQCYQLQVLDIVDPRLIYDNYLYQTSISLGLNEHFVKYSEKLLAHVEEHKDIFVIDIGCNDGSLLRAFDAQVGKVLGIEPAKEIARQVNESGIETIHGYFSLDMVEKILSRHGSAEIITANNVMANIEDMNEFAAGIKSLLKETGIFSFETGYLIDLIGNRIIDNIYHEHICYFRLKPLMSFFDRHGLEIYDVFHSDSKGGSIQALVQHKNGPRDINHRVSEMVEWESALLFDELSVYENFSAQMMYGKKQLCSLLRTLKGQGKKIAAYGASVGVTTLVYYYGLDSEIIDVFYDDNPCKHGRYSPGSKIAVQPSAKIYTDKPDYIIIFPWRYAQNIMDKHSRFKQAGGHFIVPLPRVKVI